MFVRGGVYRVVKQALGGTLAKLSVSALLFDYVLTGPDQLGRRGAVSRGIPDRHAASSRLRQRPHSRQPVLPPCFASLVTIYFWWKNIQGIHESSERALQIMKITTVMVVMLIVWCLITIVKTWRAAAALAVGR